VEQGKKEYLTENERSGGGPAVAGEEIVFKSELRKEVTETIMVKGGEVTYAGRRKETSCPSRKSLFQEGKVSPQNAKRTYSSCWNGGSKASFSPRGGGALSSEERRVVKKIESVEKGGKRGKTRP